VDFRDYRRNFFNSSTVAIHLRFKPPTIPSIVSFGAGRWCTTGKDPARAIPSGPFLVDLRQSSCGFA
jgi:hypothetical protein